MKFKLEPQYKAYLYRTLKKILETLTVRRVARRQMMELILKFTPGDDVLHLRKEERNIILGWLYQINEAAVLRKEYDIVTKTNHIIESLNHPYGQRR